MIISKDWKIQWLQKVFHNIVAGEKFKLSYLSWNSNFKILHLSYRFECPVFLELTVLEKDIKIVLERIN